LKIASIEVTALRALASEVQETSARAYPSSESCVVEISTEDGLTGVGDCQRPESPEALAYFIRDVFSPILLGADPSQIERLWTSMYQRLRIRGRTRGVSVEALSAVDLALWDLVGKSRDLPVYELLGGRSRDQLAAYATAVMYGKPVAERLGDAEEFLRRGFKAFKVVVGKDMGGDLAFIRELRDRCGREIQIALDANCALTLKRSLEFCRNLEKYEIMWLEEPLPPEFLEDYITLRNSASVPIAAGESEFTIFGFKDWIAKGALDIVQPDVGRAGGITQLKKIAALVEAFGVEFAPHCGHGSAITYAATVQFCASIPHFKIFELEQLPNPLREHLILEKVAIDKTGAIPIPYSPGIGVELDREFLTKHKVLELKVS
jgi:D-galactarolactone cycloisomerase